MFKNSKIVIYLILFVYSVVFILPICYAEDTQYVWSSLNDEAYPTSTTISTEEGNFLNLTSGSAILMEQNTGKILYEHNIHEALRPASVTKIMTLLLIMEALDSR